MHRISQLAGHVQGAKALSPQPTAGYCGAEKADDDVVICCAVRTPLCKAKRGAFKDSE